MTVKLVTEVAVVRGKNYKKIIRNFIFEFNVKINILIFFSTFLQSCLDPKFINLEILFELLPIRFG